MFSPGIDKEERIVHLPLCVQIQCDWVLRLSTSGKGCYISAKFDANKLQKLYLARSYLLSLSVVLVVSVKIMFVPRTFMSRQMHFF